MNWAIKTKILLALWLLPDHAFSQGSNKPLEPQMVLVKGGTYMMGCNTESLNEKPSHKVTIGDFYIGRYEVTQAQWRSVMHTYPSDFCRNDDGPEENISWNDVQKFVKKNKRADRQKLPSSH